VRHNDPKTVIVVPVVRVVIVAVGRARIVIVVVEGTATQHTRPLPGSLTDESVSAL